MMTTRFSVTWRVFVFLVLVTWVFTLMDWKPIHNSYMQYGDWPHASVESWWGRWSRLRYWSAVIVCPPCAAMAEHYYFVFFELEAGLAERDDLLLKHIPDGYPYEGVLAPSGFWFGQGGEDNSNPWKHVSLLAWWLYWLPYTVLWWLAWGDVFSLRWPWWVRWLGRLWRGEQ